MQIVQNNPVFHKAYVGSAATYADEQKTRRYEVAGKLALGAADVYVAGATAFAPAGGTLADIMPWMSGAAGIYHGIRGIIQVWPDNNPSIKDYACGSGNLITAAGFGMLAFGMGPMALPVIVIGQSAIMAGEHFGGRS